MLEQSTITGNMTENFASEKDNDKQKAVHLPEKCQCGCVPNILSLFDMAKLREERKIKQKK